MQNLPRDTVDLVQNALEVDLESYEQNLSVLSGALAKEDHVIRLLSRSDLRTVTINVEGEE